jgi:ferredoxin, 2Fe-2S
MSRITVLPHPHLCPTGTSFDALPGTSICDALLTNHIAIEHACEKVAACSTCHIYIREGAASLNDPDDDEEDQLDDAWGVEAASRLACCARIGGADVTVELPMHTRNLARE